MANPLMGMMGGNAVSAPATPTAPAGSPLSNMGMLKQAAQQLKKVMATIQVMKNPQQAIMQMAQQDPQLNAVIQMCQGRNPQDVFAEQCKAHGVDPQAAMQQIQQLLS